MPTRSSWSNPDGLTVYFGKRYTENSIAHSNPPSNGVKVVEVYVRGEDIAASVADAATLAADPRAVTIPAGSVITSAVFVVSETFASGGAATLDIGLTSLAGVVADMNGIDAAVAIAALDAGDRVACDGALVNAATSAALAASYKIVFGYGTAAYTAGSGRLVLTYIEPPVQTA
jgi:hypothetical protein